MSKYEIPFLTSAIQLFAQRFAMTRQAAFRYLQKYKALAFLMEFYDVEHLQSMDDTIDDMLIICRQNGGTLAWYYSTELIQQYYFGSEKALRYLKKSKVQILWHKQIIIK